MEGRSNLPEVRNPLLSLSAVQRIADLPPEAQSLIIEIMGEIAGDARKRAQQSWLKNKGPMAAYWKAVGAYAEHLRRAAKRLRTDQVSSPSESADGGQR